MMFRSGFIHII